MKTPPTLLLLTLLSALSLISYLTGVMADVIDWVTALGLGTAFRFLVLYLFLYWIVVEVKNSYLEWKYLEDG